MKTKLIIGLVLALSGLVSCGEGTAPRGKEKTTFQTHDGWSADLDIRSDAVMVYGVGGNPSDPNRAGTIEDRLRSWKERGYTPHFMTGIAWGNYRDYFTGEWDGKWHLDEGQVDVKGDTIWHGPLIPYIVPTENYLKYFKEKHIKRVIDAGAEAIFLEEPEFWARSGYSDAFKREWQAYYGEPWRPQDESPEATYMSGKLKYHLYYRALDEAFTYAKEYGKSKGLDIKCYVPTHSLLNYSQWQIVSPEASLASLPCVDGYIAQVWTGTSRAMDYLGGVEKERVFETAYLEYGCMQSMTEPTGRKVWFLTDPIEDWPRDWEDYRRNYHATFTAKLLYPQNDHYEVMPWPERIYRGLYRTSADSEEKTRIPADYATMMQVMVNSLNFMPLSDNALSGTQGLSVLMGNSLMFQRGVVHDGYEDPQLSNFYGLAMPLVKAGIPVGISHIENLGYEKALRGVKVLLMTYSNMKPLDPKAHEYLAAWVKKGGILIYAGRDDDPYQRVKEWWNTGDNAYKAPADHLFSLMGLAQGAEAGTYDYGRGKVCILRQDPKEFALTDGGATPLFAALDALYPGIEYKNNFTLERGPYTLVAVMDESVSDESYALNGSFVDLYDPQLPVFTSREVAPGSQTLLYDLSKAPKAPCTVASASRLYDEKVSGKSYSFIAKSPINTENVSRVLLPSGPKDVKVDGTPVALDLVSDTTEALWDSTSKTLRLRFPNSPDGVKVEISW